MDDKTTVCVTVLGTAQDGGLPHAGCACTRCIRAHRDPSYRRHPVALGITAIDGTHHLLEASRAIPDQLYLWSKALGQEGSVISPSSVTLTHMHLGHIDGLGQFGKEVMAKPQVVLCGSPSLLEALADRGATAAFKRHISVASGEAFSPSEDVLGFQLELVKVPHRDEVADTHAIVIRATQSLLFVPDHDSWKQTLAAHNCDTIREWLKMLRVDIALIDGTFWSGDELPGRDMSKVPHPLVTETIERLGVREDTDPNIIFTHLNHTNPLHELDSPQMAQVMAKGWRVAEQGHVFALDPLPPA